MTGFATLSAIAANPATQLPAELTPVREAVRRIETRLGRPLGPLSSLPRDLRRAVLLLARNLMETRK